MAAKFTGDESDPGIRRARQTGHTEPLGWKLVHPVVFADSKYHRAIQIADVIAGTAVAMIAHKLPQGCDAIVESIARHGMDESILPDFDIVNPANREAGINALILYGLATRAERHANPYENLAALYRAAEVAWARGEQGMYANTSSIEKLAANRQPRSIALAVIAIAEQIGSRD